MSVETLIQEYKSLSEPDKQLFLELLEQADQPVPDGLLAELRRRDDDLKSGKVKGISAEQVMAELYAKFEAENA